jgi:hypothetical protein
MSRTVIVVLLYNCHEPIHIIHGVGFIIYSQQFVSVFLETHHSVPGKSGYTKSAYFPRIRIHTMTFHPYRGLSTNFFS